MPRAASQLQLYVVRRMEGRPGPAWLDDQRFEQAVRITELLGTVLEFGPYTVLNDLSEEDRDIAAASGWRYASGEMTVIWNTYGALMEEIEQSGATSPIRKLFEEDNSAWPIHSRG